MIDADPHHTSHITTHNPALHHRHTSLRRRNRFFSSIRHPRQHRRNSRLLKHSKMDKIQNAANYVSETVQGMLITGIAGRLSLPILY